MISSNYLSRGDALFILNLIHQSLFCRDDEDFRNLIENVKLLIPFDFAICGVARINGRESIKSYDVVNINYPAQWLELYIRRGYHVIDPVVKENFTEFRVQYWAETYKKHNPPEEFICNAEDFGLKRGYSHGIPDTEGRGSLFSFSGDSIERHPRTEKILEYIIPHLHQCLIRILSKNSVRQRAELSQKEKEVLEWLKEGKTSWEISVILGISERTVNFHINNIKQKLEAVSRTHALAIAIEQGLIDID